MTLRPWTAFLQRRQNNTIFHEQTTRQALEMERSVALGQGLQKTVFVLSGGAYGVSA